MSLMDLKKAELVALAKENGLDTAGTKNDLVERLEEVLDWDEEKDDVEPIAVDEVLMDETVVVDDEPVLDDPLPDPIELNGNNAELDMEIVDTTQFLQAAYLHVLGREIDDGGKKHYRTVLDDYKTQTRAEVVADLLNSDEYKRRASK
jgi:hypothetical protein